MEEDKKTETQENPEISKQSAADADPDTVKHEGLRLFGHFISTFFIALIIIIAAALVIIKVTGCGLYTIESGSMEPDYPVNSVVLVKPSEFEEIEVGDVVTYVLNESGTLVTHRVISIDTEAQSFTTQGDANEIADASPVSYENVVGKAILCVPRAGMILRVITSDNNKTILIIVIIALLALSVFWDVPKKRRKKKKEGIE